MNERRTTPVLALVVGAVVLAALVTFVVCHQLLLSPRDKVIKVLSSKLTESQRIRAIQQAQLELLYKSSVPTNRDPWSPAYRYTASPEHVPMGLTNYGVDYSNQEKQ